jgi:hypothetical protein
MNRFVRAGVAFLCAFWIAPLFGKLTTPVIYGPANNTVGAPTGIQLEVNSESVNAYAFEYSENASMKNATRVEVVKGSYYTRLWINKLKFNTSYYWRVKSLTTKDSSDWTTITTFKTASRLKRYAPTQNMAKVNSSFMYVSCYRAAGFDSFEFQFDTSNQFNSNQKKSVIVPDTFNWFYIQLTQRNFQYGTTNFWRVRGLPDNSAKWTDTGSFVIFDTITPKYPTTAFLQDVKISFEFTGVNLKEAFQVQIDTNKNFNSPYLIDTFALEGTKKFETDPFSVGNLHYETYHYYRVRAVNEKDTTPWSYSAFTTKGLGKDVVIAENYADPMVSIEVRTKIGGTEAYEIQLDTVATFNSPQKQTFFSSNGIDTAYNLFFGKLYYARARPVHAKDSGLWTVVRPINILKFPNTQYPYSTSVVQITDSLQFATRTGMDGFQIQVTAQNHFDSLLFLDTVISDFKYKSIHNIKGLRFQFATQYLWRIRAWHDRDTSSWSTPLVFNTVKYPKQLTPTNSNFLGTGSTTKFSWEALKGGAKYQIIMDTTANFNSPLRFDSVVEGNELIRRNLLFRPVYYWKIRALTYNDTSDWSVNWVFKVLPVKLNYPKNNIINLSLTSLDWNSINGTTGYILEVDTNPNFKQCFRVRDTATNSFFHYFMKTPDIVGFNTKCYWRVKLFHPIDTSEWSTVWNFTTKPRWAPTLTSPTDSSEKVSIFTQLKWQAYSGAASYAVHYGLKSDFSDAVKTTSTGTSISVSLKANSRYYWRVRGRNSSGDEFYDFSETWTFLTDSGIPKPQLLTPANLSENQNLNVLFSWVKFTPATGYRVEISKDKSFNTGVVMKDATTAFATFSHLVAGTTYYWHVMTKNGAIESPWSETWSFTTKAQNSTEVFNSGSINVYPNPSSGKYQITCSDGLLLSFHLLDINGRILQTAEFAGTQLKELDLISFPVGLYFLRIETSRGPSLVKLIRE